MKWPLDHLANLIQRSTNRKIENDFQIKTEKGFIGGLISRGKVTVLFIIGIRIGKHKLAIAHI